MNLAAADLVPLWVIVAYLALLIGFSVTGGRRLRASSADYFVASRSLGPFLLLMSVFGTTMTAFALVGSTAKAHDFGIGVFGLMASTSGIIHSLMFFLVGIRLWAIGKRHDFVTQIQFFRSRFNSDLLGYLLFPILAGLVIVYLLIGMLGTNTVVRSLTAGMFPDVFPGELLSDGSFAYVGAVPGWITGIVITLVVLAYVLAGGVRAVAQVNAFQTIIFLSVGVVALVLTADRLGGVEAAAAKVRENAPELLGRDRIGHLQFLTYAFIPASVAMFPHLFQHWLTAKSAKTFRLTVIAHPIFIMIVWAPCVLIGIWAAGIGVIPPGGNSNAVLAKMVGAQIGQPFVSGLLAAGIFTAIMSSLDSQFICLGTMFTHDIVLHRAGPDRFTDGQKVAIGRLFIILVAAVTYVLSLFPPPNIFDLGVWCFSGFSSLVPLVVAAIHWRRATRAGAIASVLATVVTWTIFFYDGLVRPALEGRRPSEDYLVLDMMPVAIMVAVSTIALVVVSLVTRPPPASVVEKFFPKREGG